MNGKVAHTNTNWTLDELTEYVFKPFQYYVYKSKLGEMWYNLFGNKFFKVERMLCESSRRMDFEKYYIYCDEMGYIDVYFDTDDKNSPGKLLYSGRRNIKLTDIFDSIKWHKREISLNTLEDELV